VLVDLSKRKSKEKKKCVGIGTPPKSIKEKERHCSPMEKMTSGDLEGGWQPPAPDPGLESFLFFQVRSLLYHTS